MWVRRQQRELWGIHDSIKHCIVQKCREVRSLLRNNVREQRILQARKHFDLSQPAFLQIADYKAGVVPVHYRKVACKRSGGAKFTITGNPFFNLIEVTNVGGGGDIEKVEVRAEGRDRWIMLKRNWGEKWETDEKLAGSALTFRVTTTDGRFITSHNVAPKGWQFGQTFEGQNF
ncbi:hypothetical protein DM860_001106 [Cuscuta australis]|uniref:Expansin n=1 Tax=Cuscuta australis TaxID=267555 RepID=A0A328DTX5_9ASTE|nr:hypothetical protein DM860_001106 [Cuscuta australis]